jgi:radical SAM superfamily enzyme YgiQ (UPF0313 family)
MIRKLCLVFPRFRHKSGDPPLGICYIASYLRKRLDIQVSILDTTFHPSLDYVSAFLQAEKPEVVGISFTTPMYEDGINIARIAKDMGAIVVAGGPHATVCPESLIKNVDIICIGEAEETMYDLMKVLPSDDCSQVEGIWYHENNTIRKNPPRKLISNLDSLEYPALDLVEINRYLDYWHYLDCIEPGLKGINVIASRGCSYNCTYCQPTLDKIFGKKTRFKSPEYLVNELTHYIDKYKVDKFFLHDDTFAENKEWAHSFFDVLEEQKFKIIWGCNSRIDIDERLIRRMYEVGVRVVHFGIEAGSQRVISKIFHKGIKVDKVKGIINTAKTTGIYCGGYFMLGAPTETEEEINKTIRLAVSSELDEASFSITTPIPGTRLFDKIKNDERYVLSQNFSDFDYYNKNLSYSGGGITSRRLAYLHKKALFLFYLTRWNYILRHILSMKGIFRLYVKVRRFI